MRKEDIIKLLINYWARKLKVEIKKIKLTNAKSYTGLAYIRKHAIHISKVYLEDLDFNGMNYLALHEVAHFRGKPKFNGRGYSYHNTSFKNLMTRNMPNWREIKKRLWNKRNIRIKKEIQK